jgi:hypothetical protein
MAMVGEPLMPEGIGYMGPDELRRLVHYVVAEAQEDQKRNGTSPGGRPVKDAAAYVIEAGRLLQGAAVEYWSDTFNRWVAARVNNVNTDGTLDLDVKRGANPAKVRTKTDEGDREVASPASVGTRIPETTMRAPPEPPQEAPFQPQVGERVQYWSDTFYKWVDAAVVKLNRDGSFDLDVKRGAHPGRIRPHGSLGDGPPQAPSGAQGNLEAGPAPLMGSVLLPATPPQSPPEPPMDSWEPRQSQSTVGSRATATDGPNSFNERAGPAAPAPADAASGAPKQIAAMPVPTCPLAGQLRMSGEKFDAARELSRILESLGLTATTPANVEAMTGFTGGLNDGVWFLTVEAPGLNGMTHFAMKLVSSRRKYPTMPTEVENFHHMCMRWPAMRRDPTLAFPVKLLDCVPPSKTVTQNLIIMPRAIGTRLGDWLGLANARGQMDQIVASMERLGRDLRTFHVNYSTHHADFQPSNVYLGRLSGAGAGEQLNVFIDIGGVGTAVGETDQVHFTKSLELLGKAYGADFVRSATDAFMDGYNSL